MAGAITTLMPAALALFTLALAVFGGLSYGFYNFGASWTGLAFFGALVASLFILSSSLKNFFGKFSGRMMFAFWIIGLLGAYFVFLFQNGKYPMGIDLAGGSELIYRLDYTQANINIEKTQESLNAAKAKDPESKETRQLQEQVMMMEQNKNTAPDKAAEVVRRRIDPTGTKGIPVTTYGSDKQRLRIQLPRATPEEVNNIKKAIETQGRLTFHIVTDNQQIKDEVLASPTGLSKDGQYIKKEIRKKKQFSDKPEDADVTPVVIHRVPGMDGSKITYATASHSQEGIGYEINVTFNPAGAVEFGQLTEANKKKQMAIMLDGVVHSAPVIQEAIYERCRISGNFSQKEAEELAGILQAGSLPAEVKYENEFTVGPTLGAEQIESGMLATAIGTVAVISFMLIYYRLSGLIASLCTILTVITLMGAMGFFKATLTLPGIAGIVLTLGMAVDANVLILERMREELERGRTVRLAVTQGFDRAFLTIIDCQLTTVISGVILYYLGTGPVRGFAVSLTMGILITLFCNLWLNWIIMEWLVSRDAIDKINMMQLFSKSNFDFMKYRKPAMVFTGATALLSLVLVFSGKDLYDVDFTGGTLMQFNFAPGKAKSDEEVKNKIRTELLPSVEKKAADALAKLEKKNIDISTQSFGSADEKGNYRSFTITTQITDTGIVELISKELMEVFKADLEPPAVVATDSSILVRFDKNPGVTSEVVTKRLNDAKLESAKELANREISNALTEVRVGKIEDKGTYLEAELTGLPTVPEQRGKVIAAIESARLEDRAGGPISRKNSFGAQVAGEMFRDAILALIMANLGVFIYLWFRFEFSGAWGFGAILALIHDTLVAAGGVALANMLGFPIKIDLNIVAALLTIIGFSVNDTIVTFDRIREVKAAHPTRQYEDIVNEAVNATLSRTILTAATVICAVLSLLIFGGPTIKGLAWTLLVGFTVGMYSSVFIASPLMIWWYRRFGSSAQAPAPAAPKQVKGDAPAGAQI
ncbi:MAG TPA: protein translocase subunit SecD [Planctomycetota bacterium]|nr:protein translocase subunit SecD [Planctomycetota bacterium]